MIKVALDARYGLHANRRGIGVYVYHLLREWKSHPPDGISWVAFGDRRADPSVMAELSSHNIEVQILREEPFAIWEQVAFPRAAVKAGCTLIHATANVAPLVCPLPLVLTLHDVIEWHRGKDFPSDLSLRHRLSRLYRMNAIRRNVKQARIILTESSHAARDIVSVLGVPESRIVVAPIGYAVRQIEPDDSVFQEENLTPKGYALAFGAMDPRKNVEMLLDLWKSTVMPIDLVVVGFEPSALEEVTKRWGGIPGIHLLGFESDAVIRDLLDNARVFLFPSLYEGFGLPVLEAMASGIGTIIAEGTSIAEMVGDTSLVLNPRDPQAWRSAIVDLSGPFFTEQRILSGRDVSGQFKWESVAQIPVRVYQRTLNQASS